MRKQDQSADGTASESELWDKYRDGRGIAERNAILLRHMPLVSRIAKYVHQRLPREVHVDDLVQVGSVGLMRAVEAYDPARGVPFPLYASRRIRGAILDDLRSADWVPRRVRQRVKAEVEAAEALEVELGRKPSPEEVRDSVKLPPDFRGPWAAASRVAAQLNLSSLNVDFGHGGTAPGMEDGWADPRSADPCDVAMRRELVDALLSGLTERQMTFVQLHYFKHRSFQDVARHLGVSERWAFKLGEQVARRIGTLADGGDRGFGYGRRGLRGGTAPGRPAAP